MSNLKMYFLIKDNVDAGHAVNSMGHAGAMISTRGWPKDDPIMNEWYKDSFRKCTCRVTPEQFEKAKTYGDYFTVEEMTFDDKEVILVFKPRLVWPKFFQFLPLYK